MSDSNLRTRVKVCGLTRLEDARYASGAMADYLGFIFYPGSKRYIEPERAAEIITWLEGPQTVGVFVNQALDDVTEIAAKTGIDLIQLHGAESPEYCGLMPKPVIKAIHITPEDDLYSIQEKIQPYLRVAAYFLFDTSLNGESGGTGAAFNWEILEDFDPGLPWFLAGGISNENVSRAVRLLKPYGVDVNSSLEIEPAIKDPEKQEAFFETMQRIWNTQDPD